MLDARNLGYVLNNEFDVQPIKKDERSPGERLMAKANARIELEQIPTKDSDMTAPDPVFARAAIIEIIENQMHDDTPPK